MNYPKPQLTDCPEAVAIHGKLCERTNLMGDAYYSARCWPFSIRIQCQSDGWHWDTEGLGTRVYNTIPHTADPGIDLSRAVAQSLVAAGDIVRKVLKFTEYVNVDSGA